MKGSVELYRHTDDTVQQVSPPAAFFGREGELQVADGFHEARAAKLFGPTGLLGIRWP